jgi:two-component system OmpR family sensor kinase
MTIHERMGFVPSITARLIVGLTLGTTLLWCIGAAYATYIAYHELSEAFDHSLEEAARRLLPLAADDLLGHDAEDARAIQHFVDGRREYFSYQLRDASGHIVLRAHDAPLEPYSQLLSPGFITLGKYRLFTSTDDALGLTITVAETTKDRWEAVTGAALAMFWPLAGVVPLNALVIWLVVRGAMKPVIRLSGDIGARSGSNLAPLDISDQPLELRSIADSVARLMERLRSALEAERAFAANSAHELRTPIAGALAQIQRMMAESTDVKVRRRARDAEVTLKRLSSLTEKLMQISRVDAGIGFGDRKTDLIPVLDLVVRDCVRALEEPKRVNYIRHPDAKLVAQIDLDAFAMAVRNLIDNAINHGDPGGRVDIIVESTGLVRIRNDGPIVPSHILEGLKGRFMRGETRSSGSGLGLAIVETIMMQTGGTLELLSPAPGHENGFEAQLMVNQATDGALSTPENNCEQC